ncbi:MAG: DUF1844 domain-containing protein [Candidatus Binatia bacterium]
MADEHEADRPFKVQDRRRFDASGEARQDVPEPSPESGAAPPPPIDTGAGAAAGEAFRSATAAESQPPPPEINFSTFIISLSTQALALLGEIPDPVERQTRVDLDAARQIIDILGMLNEKTRGNLDAGESALLDNALYDLRMRYVARAHSR